MILKKKHYYKFRPLILGKGKWEYFKVLRLRPFVRIVGRYGDELKEADMDVHDKEVIGEFKEVPKLLGMLKVGI